MGRLRWLAFLVALASTATWACDETPSPSSPCNLDCGANGTCIIATGRESCVCRAGYTGDGCLLCAEGYVTSGSLCLPDPCIPNPCTASHRTQCTAVDGAAQCACDPGSQDHDGDGTCRPTCKSALIGFGPEICDDSSGEALFQSPRTCAVSVRFDPKGETFSSLLIRGEFNNWDDSYPMILDTDGTYFATLNLAPGHYAYKFYTPQGERWFEDPGNLYFKWSGGERNSRLIVPDCQKPYLRLMHRPEVQDGKVHFKVQYVDGAAGAQIGTAGVTVTRNGQNVSAAFDAPTGVVTVTDTLNAHGKYAYRFNAQDQNGQKADLLYVPLWHEETPFDWNDGLMYFVLTDRFADGDPNNNAPTPDVDFKANWQGGDFAGLLQKIEAGYFDDLGVNVLWLSSISQNTPGLGMGDDGVAYSAYHSYWPISTGWTADNPLPGVEPVDPHFGTLEDFRAVVEAAHRRGIRVLVDFVANHVHEHSPLWSQFQHTWFNTNPKEICEHIGWSKPITCWFAPYLPDFHFENQEALERMLAHAEWLVQETNIDGFRLDAVKHMIDDFSYGIRGRMEDMLRMTGLRFYMVGETFTGEDGYDQLKYYVRPEMLDGQFDFPLYWKITKVFLRMEEDFRAMEGMMKYNDGYYGDWAVMSTFLGNHDVCRALSHANGDFGDLWCNGGKAQGWSNPPGTPTDSLPYRKLRMAWTLLMATPGIPLIYYGDEFGLEGAGDPDNRKFMRFGNALNQHQVDTLAHVQELAAFRHQHPALRRGKRSTLDMASDGQAWVFAMESPDDLVIVAFNRTGSSRTLSVNVAALALKNGDVLVDALSGASVTVNNLRINIDVESFGSALYAVQ